MNAHSMSMHIGIFVNRGVARFDFSMNNVCTLKRRGIAAVLAASALAAAAKEPVVAVNEDNDHYFKQDASLMTEEALRAYVRGLAGGKVTHFLMCPSGQRPSYGSKVWEPIWTGLSEPGGYGHGGYTTWAKNAKLLFDKGIDPYAVWIDECRKSGISPWLSPRMNDAHNADSPNPFRSTTFWRERDDLHCEPGYRGGDWTRATFNFARDEVQDYTFALVKEQLDRYDIDGYELDFMRFADYFPRAVAAESSPHLDRFVKRVRDYADAKAAERGHAIRLGVRVATTPQIARSKGCDVGRWVREGWVDWVCACPYWETPDYDLPVAEWREWFGDRAGAVTLLAGTDHGVSAAPPHFGGVRLDMEAKYYAGFADVQWGNGADGLYLFNVPYLTNALAQVARRGLFPGDLPRQRRAYPVSWRADAWWCGADERFQIPKKTDAPREFRIRLGARPVGRPSVVVGVKEEGPFAPEVTLNGVSATGSHAAKMEIRPTGITHPGVDYTCRRYYFPDDAVHGGADNVVRVGPTAGAKTILWCEIDLEPEGFVYGADTSWMTEMESKGVVFKTTEGEPRDCLSLMKDYGVSAIRLRVWVDPDGGWNGKADTIAKAKRAAAAGLDVMVDFHFSDFWADPAHQAIPKAWRGHDAERLRDDIASHVRDVLGALKEAGVRPKWVQIGNETTFGFLWTAKRDEAGHAKWIELPDGRGWALDVEESMANLAYEPENYARLFAAGTDAAKEVFPEAAVIVHLSEGERFDFTEKNLDTLRKFGAKWDIVGLSVYPRESWHADVGGDAAKYDAVNARLVDAAVANVVRGAARWGTPYMIVETGVEPCPKGTVTQERTAAALARFVERVREDTGGACRGIFYWEPECTPSMYDKGAFGEDNRPTPVMAAFAGDLAGESAAPEAGRAGE